jgi:hypothetical protein
MLAQLLATADPCVEILDVSAGWDSIAQVDLVVHRLEELGLYRKDLLLYCAASWENIANLGLEPDECDKEKTESVIQASTEDQIRDRYSDRNMMAEGCELGTLIVYESSRLQKMDANYRYLPLSGIQLRDAVVIIFGLASDDS